MKITGFENVLTMYDLKISIAMNRHSVCSFSAIINENEILKFVDMAKNERKVEVVTEANLILMKGIVHSVKVKKSYIKTIIFVSIISNSIKAEKNVNKRVYQDTTKKVKDIISKYDYNISFQRGERLDEVIENIIVQDSENDFSFLKNIAARYECGLWIEDDGFVIGLINNTVTLKNDLNNSRESIISYDVEYTTNCTIYKLETQKYIKNGSTINFEGEKLIVIEVEITEFFDEPYYLYTAVSKIDFSAYINNNTAFALGRGEVVKNIDKENRGRLQVKFLDYENIEGNVENNYMIPYLTTFEGKDQCGFRMIPDGGDVVMI